MKFATLCITALALAAGAPTSASGSLRGPWEGSGEASLLAPHATLVRVSEAAPSLDLTFSVAARPARPPSVGGLQSFVDASLPSISCADSPGPTCFTFTFNGDSVNTCAELTELKPLADQHGIDFCQHDCLKNHCRLMCGECGPAPGPGPAPTPTPPPPPPPPPAPVPNPVPAPGPSGPAQNYVVLHNAKRRLHVDTPDLIYDADLAAQAQAYADTCPTGHGTYASRNHAGENLAWSGSSAGASVAIDYDWAVGAWYDEIGDYLWPTSPGDPTTAGPAVGHFTQVVWRATARVGCGARSDCGNMFHGMANNAIVCRYAPAGNYLGQYHLQVGPLETDEPDPIPDHYYTVCASSGRCPEGNEAQSQVAEDHEIRCCSDVELAGWNKRWNCDVWASSQQCLVSSFSAAMDMCSTAGARLCTRDELTQNCSRGSGCGFDRHLIWSSTPVEASLDSARTDLHASVSMETE